MIEIRESTKHDNEAINKIHLEAFGPGEGPEIVELVSNLFADKTAKPLLSLVAVVDNEIAGHVLFTKARLADPGVSTEIQLLAPLAVAPHLQKKGVGAKLVNTGLELLKQSATELVFVLGHPTYYPRCGFKPVGDQGLDAPYPIPEKDADAWMVLELQGNKLGSISGKILCAEALDRPEYWVE